MKTSEIRKKLHHYIETAEEKKVKAIFTIVEEEIREIHDHWADKVFVAEIEKRTKEMESGKMKTYSWTEVQQRAGNALRKAKSKKNVQS